MKKLNDLRLSSILCHWYNENKRDLPWRNVSDPYAIWLSEIILQQTRVDQGYSYFCKFIQKYPNVTLLAAASEDEVLKLWQGLGYYSRARNLHHSAKMVVDAYKGVFPKTYKEILTLKGVGEYTAAAIASFAYNDPYAVVDGNVYRVLSRIFAIDEPINSTKGKKIFAELAQELLDKDNAAEHNQAIMEFGALQCVPVSPDCGNCPASEMCLAYARNKVSTYPVKEKKQKIRHRYFNYLDIRCGDYMYLHKRTGKDIWQNLYELPLIETDLPLTFEGLQQHPPFAELFSGATRISVSFETEMKHVLSHQIINAVFYKIETDMVRENELIKISPKSVGEYPVSRLVHKYLEGEFK